jgi:hypothetical protein
MDGGVETFEIVVADVAEIFAQMCHGGVMLQKCGALSRVHPDLIIARRAFVRGRPLQIPPAPGTLHRAGVPDP